MDLNEPLFWLGLIGGFVMLLRGARTWSSGGKSWAVVGVVVVATAATAHTLASERAGFIAFGVWSLLVLAPNLVSRSLQRAIDRQEYDRAAKLARVLAIVHPAPSTRLVALDREVSALWQRGDVDGVEALLGRATKLGGFSAKWAAIERHRIAGRWVEIIDTFDATIVDADLKMIPSFVAIYLRALGETGRRSALFRAFARLGGHLEGDVLARQRAVAWLIVLAFAGKRAELDRLLRTRLTTFTPALVSFWRATADLASGDDSSEATSVLEALARGADQQLARASERRLRERSLLVAEPLSLEQEAACTCIVRALDQEERFAISAGGRPKPWMVVALIAANVAMYGVEWATGDPTSEKDLFELGALLSPAVIDGHEWWRLGTCLFLHFGATHLVMNMLGLWVLGPFVEYSIGRARWLFVYLGSGLFGSAVLTVLPRLHLTEPDLCVGASGCIMGLVGATIAVVLRGVLRERAVVAKRRLYALGFVVALQTTFDLLTPQVSFLAHASGLVAGFVLTSLLAHRTSAAS